ncbi:DUF4760 domain-containing protein [Oceanicaulis alexandrii]|uniref:DUF4760 domain-containing protein n=1 Tax=Oceanicaulis alexandrii TaxID=153233 RepID=UPI0035CF75EE
MTSNEMAAWVAAFGTILSAVVALGVAIVAFLINIQKDRQGNKYNTIQYIRDQASNPILIGMFEQFRQARRTLRNGHIGSFGMDQVGEREISYEGRLILVDDVIKKLFNYYEVTAIGIKDGGLDENIIKDWWRTSYVLDFIDFAIYVYQRRLRDDAGRLFINYEELALRWATEDEARLIEDAQAKARSWWR